MFSTNAVAKIWKVQEKNNYALCQISTSKKNNATGKYENDFRGIARFVGKAFRQRPQENQKIRITSCGVSNSYDRETGKEYISFVVFDYELVLPDGKMITTDIEEDLPFLDV